MSHQPTDAALLGRARTLVERMTEKERWVYAVPPEEARERAPDVLAALGWQARGPSRWEPAGGGASLELLERPELAVTLVVARGAAAAEALGALLGATTFYAQTTLLAHAHDRDDEESETALATLAPMAVVWDAAWESLFAAHLADQDAVVRAAASTSLVDAARASGAVGPIHAMLDAAIARESDPNTRASMQIALAELAKLMTQ